MRRALVIATAAAAVWAAAAVADGVGPTPGIGYGSPGLVDRAGAVRYVALPSKDGTTVAALGAKGGRVLRWSYLRGVFGIPMVAWDGSMDGLTHDGRRLVLTTGATYGSKLTRFVVLDPKNLRVRKRLLLHGAFAFDALSPGGSLMYVLQYVGGFQSGRYAVRAVNLNTRRLYAGAIVDRREPDEKMTGQAVTRAASADGVWAFTLYGRPRSGPFVHALDTVHRRAFCIDLPWHSPPAWLGRAHLRVRGAELLLQRRGRTLARIDTRTWEVSR